jgi:CheY-like chemotaxis protein
VARTVLIADDSPTIQKRASGILTGEGIEVVTVSNGVAAIKKLPTVKPLVILADVSMPGKDGYEVCEFVKGSADFPNVSVLLVFSDDDIYDEQKGARAHADGRIKKPFSDPAELIAMVAKHLALAEASAPKPKPSPFITKAPPPPPEEVEPMDEEPEVATKKESPDFSEFGGGLAFGEAMEAMEAKSHEAAPALESDAPSEPAHFAETESEPAPHRFDEPEAPSRFEAPIELEPEIAEAPKAEPPPPAEPVFIEEQAAPPPSPPPSPADQPLVGGTVMFRLADIAAPVLSDETEAAPAEAAAPVDEESASGAAEPAVAPEPESQAPPVAASTLESYSLSEAAAGHVRFASTESAEEPAAQAATPAGLDTASVYWVVYMVVAKMSPRMTPEAIQDMAKNLTDEIMAELNAPAP